jgi:ABC-2 type transport system ATP-binding protein
MIKLKGVSKKFGRVSAVEDVSFEVDEAEVVGFLGPNGAGKTTTMRMITGYLQPTSGKIRVDSIDPSVDRVVSAERIGYLPENNPLYNDMKVGEYLNFIAEMKNEKRKMKSGLIESNVREIAELCGVDEKMKFKIDELSRGYKQRVGLAAAMLGDPKALILDEPTSGLDPNQVIDIRKLIKKLGRKKTVVLSTHVLQEVEAMCSRVIIINKGRIVYDGRAPKKKGALEKKFRKVTLGKL